MSNDKVQKEIEKIEAICEHAELWGGRRGNAIVCKAGHGKPNSPYVLGLHDGDVCVATVFLHSGHTSLDSFYETDKMYGCRHRKTKG